MNLLLINKINKNMTSTKIKNEIEHLWTIICGSASIDGETNSLSLFNIVEEITIQNLTNQIVNPNEKKGINFPFEIISCIRRSQELDNKDMLIDFKIDLLDPDNKILQTINSKVEMKSQHSRLRIRIKSNGITVSRPGNYNFLVNLKEDANNEFREITKVPFVVKMPVSVDLNILKK